MLDKLTDRSRKILKVANEEARRQNSEFVGTEHLLLGILEEGGGSASKVLARMGIVPAKMKAEIERVVAPVTSKTPVTYVSTIPFSPRAKRVLELAEEEATREGSPVVATEHILLGLSLEVEGIASDVLKSFDITKNKLRQTLDEVLGKTDAAREKLLEIQQRIMTPTPGPCTVRVWIFKDHLLANQASRGFLMFQGVKVYVSDIVVVEGVPFDKQEAIAASIAKECGAIAHLVESGGRSYPPNR